MSQLNPTGSSPDHGQEHDEAPQTLSLLGGIARPADLPEADPLNAELPSSTKRGLSQGTLLLIGAVLLAAGSLYLMRLVQGDLRQEAGPQKAEAKIEQVLAKLNQPGTLEPESPLLPENLEQLTEGIDLVQVFNTDYTGRQVPVEYVKKNPFRLNLPTTEKAGPTGPTPDAIRAQRLKQLQSELARLELQTVMGGQTPLAVINGQFVRAGQQLGSFHVESIHAQGLQVVLTAEGERFTLSMQKPQEDTAPRRRR